MGSALSENLARLRKTRDLSQEALAATAGLGVDTIARIEQGTRVTCRPTTLRKLATALGVTPAALSAPAGSPPRTRMDVAALRRAISTDSTIPGLSEFAEHDELPTIATLTREVHDAWRDYVNGRHVELLGSLPVVLVDARRLVHATTVDARAVAHRALATALRVAAGIAGRLELDDLAWTAAEQALTAARQSDRPEVETAISLRYLAWTLVRQSRHCDAERVAVAAAQQIQSSIGDTNPILVAVYGNLLFNAATAALSGGQPGRAADLLVEAHEAAARRPRDIASEAGIFGPRAVALQEIEHTVRTGDPQVALVRAARLPTAAGRIPPFWEAGHRLHLADAAVRTRRYDQALGYLHEARTLAPDWVRAQPLGLNTMRTLVDRATRRRGPHFAALATHYGIG